MIAQVSHDPPCGFCKRASPLGDVSVRSVGTIILAALAVGAIGLTLYSLDGNKRSRR